MMQRTNFIQETKRHKREADHPAPHRHLMPRLRIRGLTSTPLYKMSDQGKMAFLYISASNESKSGDVAYALSSSDNEDGPVSEFT